MQKGERVTPISLNCCSSELPRKKPKDTRFSVEVSISGNDYPRFLRLPILNDKCESLVFKIGDFREVQLRFNIFRTVSADVSKGVLIGSGTALLGTHDYICGPSREHLFRAQTIPILENGSIKFMGKITFTFVFARPFGGDIPSEITPYYIEPSIKTRLVGHRGRICFLFFPQSFSDNCCSNSANRTWSE